LNKTSQPKSKKKPTNSSKQEQIKQRKKLSKEDKAAQKLAKMQKKEN